MNIKHPIGLEPINLCFEGICCTNSGKDANNIKSYLNKPNGINLLIDIYFFTCLALL